MSTVKCKNCGKETEGDQKFCTECGAELDTQKTCSRCGSVLEGNNKFCTECGAPIEDNQADNNFLASDNLTEDRTVFSGNNKSTSKNLTKIIVGVIAVAILAIGGFLFMKNRVIEVEPQVLLDIYMENKSEGDKEYTDRVVKMVGVVNYMEKVPNSPYFQLSIANNYDANHRYWALRIVLNKDKDADLINQLKSSEKPPITIEGTCRGIVMYDETNGLIFPTVQVVADKVTL